MPGICDTPRGDIRASATPAHVRYFSDALKPWIARRDRLDRFVLRRDPRDLSRVWVLDPDGVAYLEVPYRTLAHPPVTLWSSRLPSPGCGSRAAPRSTRPRCRGLATLVADGEFRVVRGDGAHQYDVDPETPADHARFRLLINWGAFAENRIEIRHADRPEDRRGTRARVGATRLAVRPTVTDMERRPDLVLLNDRIWYIPHGVFYLHVLRGPPRDGAAVMPAAVDELGRSGRLESAAA